MTKTPLLRFCAVLLLFACAMQVPAIDQKQTAQVTIRVLDKAGKPMPNTPVVFSNPDDLMTDVTLKSDPQGFVTFTQPFPEKSAGTDIFWNLNTRASPPGYMPLNQSWVMFPGAVYEVSTWMQPATTTRLHFRGPQGRPLAYLSFRLQAENTLEESVHTDSAGDYQFSHQPGHSKIVVSYGETSRDVPNVPEATLHLTQADMPSDAPTHPLELTLLQEDGTPAAGWFIPQGMTRDGVRTIIQNFSQEARSGYNVEQYTAEGWVKTSAVGTATVKAGLDAIVFVSPDGVPFLYQINPETWHEAVHRLVFKLPDLRQTVSGQLVYPDGKPAANIPITIRRIRSHSKDWCLKDDDAASEGAVTRLPALSMTDESGHYTLKQYMGFAIDYKVGLGRYEADLTQTTAPVVLKPIGEFALKQSKRLTLNIHDKNGPAISGFITISIIASKNNAAIQSENFGVQDTRGQYFFIPQEADSVSVTVKRVGWTPYQETLNVSGKEDLVRTITFPASHRLPLLSGIVLDPLGQPVVQARIDLLDFHPGWIFPTNFFGYTTMTDGQGKFSFVGAPAAGEIQIQGFLNSSSKKWSFGLPGWTEMPKFTSKKRHLLITLHPVGSIRILLPPEIKKYPTEINLGSLERSEQATETNFDPAGHLLWLVGIRPGRYSLSVGKESIPQTITANRENVVDLRSDTHLIPKVIPEVETQITVRNGSVPAPGVQVLLVHTIQDKPYSWRDDVIEAGDLTDRQGQMRFRAEKGQHLVAVARIPGKSLGWTALTVAPGKSIVLSLRPTQTVTITLQPVRPQEHKSSLDTYITRKSQIMISIPKLSRDEARALWYALDILHSDDDSTPNATLAATPDTLQTTQELPTGVTYHLNGYLYDSWPWEEQLPLPESQDPTLSVTYQVPITL